MSGVVPLLPLFVFMAWTGKTLYFYRTTACFPSALIIRNFLLDCYLCFTPCKLRELSIHCCSRAWHFSSWTTRIFFPRSLSFVYSCQRCGRCARSCNCLRSISKPLSCNSHDYSVVYTYWRNLQFGVKSPSLWWLSQRFDTGTQRHAETVYCH